MSDKISTNKVVSSMAWVYLENIAAQLVGFLVSVVLARLLEPGHYGMIALVTVFINIANVFVSSSFSNALIQNKDSDALDYSTMFWFNLFISCILYLILFFASPFVGIFYNNIELSLVLRVLSIRIPLSALNSIQLAYVANHMVFKKSFFTNSIAAFISGVLGIAAAYMGLGIWALVVQNISNIVFSTMFMVFIVPWHPQRMFSFDRLRKMVGFGWKLLVTGLLFAAYNELRSLVIGKRYSSDNLGYYDKGYSFPKLIGANIDTTITRVLFPALSKNQDNEVKLAAAIRRSAKTSAYIMTPILFGLAMIAKPLVKVLLTDKWIPCVPYLQVMCIVWWLQPTQSCSIQGIKAIGRSDLYLYVEIISKCFGVLLIYLSVALFNSPFAIAVSMLIGQIIAVFIYGAVVSKHIGYKVGQQLLDLAVPGVISAAMCVVVYFIGGLFLNNIVSMIAQIIVGGVFYIFVSQCYKVEEFIYLKTFLISALKTSKKDALN